MDYKIKIVVNSNNAFTFIYSSESEDYEKVAQEILASSTILVEEKSEAKTYVSSSNISLIKVEKNN